MTIAPPLASTSRWPAGWGLVGVLLLLLDGVYRLVPVAWDALRWPALTATHRVFLVVWTVFAAVTEGHQTFRKRFAPRVARRMRELMTTPSAAHRILAPLYCMSLVGDEPRRMWIQRGLVVFIVGLVALVKRLPQPWRGLVDAGVVVALTWGVVEVLLRGIATLREKAQA